MRSAGTFGLAVLCVFPISVKAQQVTPLKLVQTIQVPGVEGHFDHFAVDLQGHRLFVAEEEHKTVQVFDVRTFKSIASIRGFTEPHWLLYQPESHELFVTDGDGTVKIFNASSYQRVKTVKLGLGTDCIAYDRTTKRLYVVYGGRDAASHSASIGIIDTTTGQHIGDIRIPAARIEGMDVDERTNRLFVNITSREEVGVIDLKTNRVVATWPLDLVGDANVPMRLDGADHRLFVATRTPAMFIAINTDTGKVISAFHINMDADDIFYDALNRRVYVSCGEGFVDVFQQRDPAHYAFLATIRTRPGARNSLFVPQLREYFVALPQYEGQGAAIWVFRPQP
ncbi:MAG: YncE family protein [Terriglobia bacterium]